MVPKIVACALALGACAAAVFASAATPAPPSTPASTPTSKASTLAILELDAGDKLAFAGVAKPDVSIPLTVENKTKKPIKNISIAVSPFTAPTGESVGAKVAPGATEIAAGGTQQFVVTARLPVAATYTARARVLEGTQSLLGFKVEVARTRTKPAVDVGDVAAIQETTSLGHRPLGIPLRMKLYATGGDVTVPPPVLHSASHKPKTDSAAGQSTDAKLDVSTLPASIEVMPGQPTDITARLNGLGTPGRYDLKLRFAPAGFDVIEKDVTVYVRDPAWIALGLIALGVVLSLAVHAYGGVIRPRLLLQRRVADTLAALRDLARTAGDAEAEQLVADIRKAISEEWDAARARRQPLAPHIATYEQIVSALGAWSKLHRLTTGVRPQAVRRELLTKLDEFASTFREMPPDPAQVSTSVTGVRRFPQTIRTAVETELRRQLDALDKELRADARPAAARLRNALQLVSEKLDGGRIEAAVGSFDAARLQYTALLADDLRARVTQATSPPGMTAADWSALREETLAAVTSAQSTSDAEEAMTSIAKAMAAYLRRVGAALRAAANALGDPTKAQPVLDALDAVEASLDAKNLTAAWRHVEAAQTAYQKAAVPVGRPMGPAEQGALAALTKAAGGGVLGGGAFDIMQVIDVPARAADLDLPGAGERHAARLTGLDVLASAVVLVVATLVGFQALWIDTPTWGGWASYLTAFGGGFALDQFTHAGVTAFRPK